MNFDCEISRADCIGSVFPYDDGHERGGRAFAFAPIDLYIRLFVYYIFGIE